MGRPCAHRSFALGCLIPAIGIMDAARCFESAGLIKYGNKGNMTKEEIDLLRRTWTRQFPDAS